MAYKEDRVSIDAVSINDENANCTSSGNSNIVESCANPEVIADLRMIALVLSEDVYKELKSGNRGNYTKDSDPDNMDKNQIGCIPYKAVAVKDLEEEAETLGLKSDSPSYTKFVRYLNEDFPAPTIFGDTRMLYQSGYKVQLYKWNSDENIKGYPQYIIAFAGSDNLKDWYGANSATAFNQKSKQFNYAQNVGSALKKGTKKSVLFTGHSLGGGLAACAVLQTYKKQAIVFNSSGVATPYYKNRHDLKDFERERETLQEQDILSLLKENKPLILDYFMKHDPLTWFQSNDRLPPGSSICIDDDHFTLEEGNVYLLNNFEKAVKEILRDSNIISYALNINEKEREYFKEKCAMKDGLFQGLGLGDDWVIPIKVVKVVIFWYL